ncbi:hypothetical protein MRX96_035716 [Rhipicephalus microplus]
MGEDDVAGQSRALAHVHASIATERSPVDQRPATSIERSPHKGLETPEETKRTLPMMHGKKDGANSRPESQKSDAGPGIGYIQCQQDSTSPEGTHR